MGKDAEADRMPIRSAIREEMIDSIQVITGKVATTSLQKLRKVDEKLHSRSGYQVSELDPATGANQVW
jgi:hypothetical protein